MGARRSYTDKQKVWIYPAEHAAWHFASVDKEKSRKIRKEFKSLSRGFGSLPVQVSIGTTTWKTSIFYDARHEQYILPLKAEVRRREHIRDGEEVTISFVIDV